MKPEVKEGIEEKIKKLQAAKADIEAMNKIKKEKIVQYALQITTENKDIAIFRLSTNLGMETLAKDIEEDSIRLKKLANEIEKEKIRIK